MVLCLGRRLSSTKIMLVWRYTVLKAPRVNGKVSMKNAVGRASGEVALPLPVEAPLWCYEDELHSSH